MFTNPGRKIKGFAKVLFWIQVVLYVIGAIAALVSFINMEMAGIGIVAFVLVIGVGILIAWISVLLTYGFGAVVDDVQDIKAKLGADADHTDE